MLYGSPGPDSGSWPGVECPLWPASATPERLVPPNPIANTADDLLPSDSLRGKFDSGVSMETGEWRMGNTISEREKACRSGPESF